MPISAFLLAALLSAPPSMNIVLGGGANYLSGALENGPAARLARGSLYGELEFNDSLSWHNELALTIPSPFSKFSSDYSQLGGISTGVKFYPLKGDSISPLVGLGFGFEPTIVIDELGDGTGTLSPMLYATIGARKRFGKFSLLFCTTYSRYYYLLNRSIATNHFSISLSAQIDLFHFV